MTSVSILRVFLYVILCLFQSAIFPLCRMNLIIRLKLMKDVSAHHQCMKQSCPHILRCTQFKLYCTTFSFTTVDFILRMLKT